MCVPDLSHQSRLLESTSGQMTTANAPPLLPISPFPNQAVTQGCLASKEDIPSGSHALSMPIPECPRAHG